MNTEVRAFIDETRKRLDELERNVEGETYPCVKISSCDRVVLFTQKDTGISIGNENFADDCGGLANWVEDIFILFSGTITYKNGQPVRTVREES